MKISVILAHPHGGSFNHAIAGVVTRTLKENGYPVTFHDLYAERFDPVLPFDEIPRDSRLPEMIPRNCDEIAEAQGIVFVHPNWWGMPPAVPKGWIDRVLRPGVAYRFYEGDTGEGIPQGLLKARTAIVFNTSNTPEERELQVFGDPLERLWGDCTCSFCGIPVFHRRMFQVIITSTENERSEWLSDVQELINNVSPDERRPIYSL